MRGRAGRPRGGGADFIPVNDKPFIRVAVILNCTKILGGGEENEARGELDWGLRG